MPEGDVPLQLEDWLGDEQGQRVFWFNGLAGTGKSTIAQTFAEIAVVEGNFAQGSFARGTLRTGVTFEQPSHRHRPMEIVKGGINQKKKENPRYAICIPEYWIIGSRRMEI